MKYVNYYPDPRDDTLLTCSVCGEDIDNLFYNIDGEIFCPHCSNFADEKILDIHKPDYTFYL